MLNTAEKDEPLSIKLLFMIKINTFVIKPVKIAAQDSKQTPRPRLFPSWGGQQSLGLTGTIGTMKTHFHCQQTSVLMYPKLGVRRGNAYCFTFT